MNPQLQHLFDSLETDRNLLLEKVSKLSLAQFNRAAPGKWSAGQILAHLITAEKLSLLYMNKKILGIQETGNTGIWEEMKMLLLKISQRLPLKFRAPNALVENTPAYPDFHHLKADWDMERSKLRDFLEKFDDRLLKKKIYRHIRAGRLNIRHALLFFGEHYRHHWPQIKRLL